MPGHCWSFDSKGDLNPSQKENNRVRRMEISCRTQQKGSIIHGLKLISNKNSTDPVWAGAMSLQTDQFRALCKKVKIAKELNGLLCALTKADLKKQAQRIGPFWGNPITVLLHFGSKSF